jgi:hypothetical protein
MGTFDDLISFKLASEIYIGKKPALYDLVRDHPRLIGKEFIATFGEIEK